MRLAAYVNGRGEARLAAFGEHGPVDVGGLPADYPRGLGTEGLAALSARAAQGEPAEVARFLPAVPRPGKIVCVGRNYLAHVQETHTEVPEAPCLFAKFQSSLSAHGATVVPPRATQALDYEGELAVVIGEGGRDIPEEQALAHVFGYTVACDFSERILQHRTPQWLSGKAPDGFAPLGPWIATRDEIPDPQALRVWTRVNGQTVQSGETRDMVFPVARIVAFASSLFTLEPGDVFLTGTPDGVQLGKEDPRWLQAGDLVEVEIPGIGLLESRVGAWR